MTETPSQIRIHRLEYAIRLRDARDAFEKNFIEAALQKYEGNVSRTAKVLDIGRRNLQVKITRYGIDIESIRSGKGSNQRLSTGDLKYLLDVVRYTMFDPQVQSESAN